MKNISLFVFALLTYVQPMSGQEVAIPDTLVENIRYYPVDSYRDDEYMQSECVLSVQYPKDSVGFSTIVWFHGGGLLNGELEIPEALLGQGIAVVGVQYRTFPQIKEPVYIEDAAASVAWTLDHIADFGGDPSKVFVSGHSAGGYLTSMVGLDKRWMKAFGHDPDSLAGLIPFSGHTITHFTVRKERGIDAHRPIVDDKAPLYHVRADCPPVLLITGDRELELLGRYEENAYFYRMLKVVGHPDVRLMELDGYDHIMIDPAFPLLVREVQRLSKQ